MKIENLKELQPQDSFHWMDLRLQLWQKVLDFDACKVRPNLKIGTPKMIILKIMGTLLFLHFKLGTSQVTLTVDCRTDKCLLTQTEKYFIKLQVCYKTTLDLF